MLGSRVCWQLLLGWALLLGQPVFGDAELNSSEGHSIQDPEKLAPVSEEPEKPVSEEQEEVMPELGDSEEQVPVWEKPEEKKPPSDEELEEMEKEEREWLEHEKEKPCDSWLQYLQQIAVGHYNKGQNKYYKPHGVATLTTKKAIGTMVYLKMILLRTNCTRDMLPKEKYHNIYYFHHQPYPENCKAQDGSEQECSFTLFDDARRSRYSMPVISQKCKPFRLDKENHRRPSLLSRL